MNKENDVDFELFLLIRIIIVTKGCWCELGLLIPPDLCIQLAQLHKYLIIINEQTNRI